MKNIRETGKQELLAFVRKLDSYLDHPITLVALGGTALTLLNLKSSTRDVDFIVSSKDGLIIDLYFDDYTVNVTLLHSSKEKSTLLQEFDHITLRILNFYDICVTKIDRGDERDYDDIKVILEKTDIKLPVLLRKFILTMNHSESTNPKYKLLEFVKFIKKIGYKLMEEDRVKIQQWQRM